MLCCKSSTSPCHGFKLTIGNAPRCLVEILRRCKSADTPPDRHSRQSGAPGWTLTRAGFDLSDDGDKLIKSGAAFLDGIRGGRLEGERGLWPTGLSHRHPPSWSDDRIPEARCGLDEVRLARFDVVGHR